MRKLGFFMIGFLIIFGLIGSSFSISKAQEVSEKKQKPLIIFPVPYIPILQGLEYDPSQSAILKTTNVLTGMLVYRGKFKPETLVEFFRTQMAAQGWEEIGSFTSTITFLAYKRPEGTAFISITSSMFKTEVRIVVILTLNQKLKNS